MLGLKSRMSPVFAALIASAFVAVACDGAPSKPAPKPTPAPTTPATSAKPDAATPAAPTPSPAPSEAAVPPPRDTILIGHYASMTGSEATFGVSTDRGIRLALKDLNAAGGINGKQVEVRTYDTAGKESEATTVVTRFITQDKVVALLGEVASGRSIAGGRVAQKFGVPMITPSSTNPDVTEIGDMISRVCFIDPFQGTVCAKFAAENLKLTKVATLYDLKQPYSTGLNDNFKKSFVELGGTIVTEQAYSTGDADFSAQLSSIREKGAQAIFIPGYYNDVANIAKQARRLGLTIPFIGGDGWESPKLAEVGGEAIEGSYYSNHYSPEDKRPEVQNFVKKYQSEYGEVPDSLAAMGYDGANVLFAALKKSPSLKGKDLARTIAQTKDFPGVSGKITMDEKRNARKSAVILQMKGGKPVYVATIDPPPSK